MRIDEFCTIKTREKVDFDGAFGAQCVDLFRQYSKDVLGLPHTGAVEGARQLFEDYEKLPLEKQFFERIPGTVENAKTGDVVIWGMSPSNKYGHVAIVLGVVDENNLLVFEQDGFAQDGAKIKIRSKNNLLGFLRLRKE